VKKALIALLVILGAGATLYAARGDDPADPDEAQIREVVDLYFKGVVEADRTALERAWDKNAHMKHVKVTRDGIEAVHVVPIDVAFEWWTRVKANTSMGKVLSLDIVDGKMAMVKFEFHYNQLKYIDYLSLYKVNGEWKIVNKTFVLRK